MGEVNLGEGPYPLFHSAQRPHDRRKAMVSIGLESVPCLVFPTSLSDLLQELVEVVFLPVPS